MQKSTIIERTGTAGPVLSIAPTNAAAAASAGSAGGAPRTPSLSLSIGTQKSTYELLHPTTNPYEMVETLVKVYPDKVKFYEFSRILRIRKPGYEERDKHSHSAPEVLPRELSEAEKAEHRERSIRRTRKAMNDIADCNEFDKFATFTFDPKKHDAYDADYCKRKMIAWLNNQQKLHGSFRYLMVSEPMKDGKTHFHALLGGFTGKYHPTNIRGKKEKARQCYKIDAWEKTYGFADMEDISDKTRLVNYIVKYIAKDIQVVDEGKKRYWSSKNLAQPTTVYHRSIENTNLREYDIMALKVYQNEHCTITTIPRKQC